MIDCNKFLCRLRAKLKTKKHGFSLLELIVVIAVMAVLLGVLAPSLLRHMERTRATVDTNTMNDLVSAVREAMAEPEVYDEVLNNSCTGLASCYIDTEKEEEHVNDRVMTKTGSSPTEKEQYYFKDEARLDDEVEYWFAGNMRGMSITFKPRVARTGIVYVLANGKVNYSLDSEAKNTTDNERSDLKFFNGATAYTPITMKDMSSKGLLYNRVCSIVGATVSEYSQTYRASSYTLFINLSSTDSNVMFSQNAINVYGEWSGTNLSGDNLYSDEP